DRDLRATPALEALGVMLERPTTRSAAWQALRPKLPAVLSRLGAPEQKQLVEMLGSLCERDERDQVTAANLAGIDRSLVRIDRCRGRPAGSPSPDVFCPPDWPPVGRGPPTAW